MDALRRIADAVLYEGYILWPYRRSAIKNRQRFTFGGIHPHGYGERTGSGDRSEVLTELLVEGPADGELDVTLRFLHVVDRQVVRATPDGLEPVDELTVAGRRHLTWGEATEREVEARGMGLGALAGTRRVEVAVAGGGEEEPLVDEDGRQAGSMLRSWRPLHGALEISTAAVEEDVWRLSVRVANESEWEGGSRDETLRTTLCSAHVVIRARGAELVSMTDPPERLRARAESCRNQGLWPVLVGGEGERHTVLSAPIILADHPEVAPESSGDFFDAAEIDQLLVLNVLSLTDEEKLEMAASDPRAREILERTESMSREQMMRLHGTLRDLRPVSGP